MRIVRAIAIAAAVTALAVSGVGYAAEECPQTAKCPSGGVIVKCQAKATCCPETAKCFPGDAKRPVKSASEKDGAGKASEAKAAPPAQR